MRMAKFKVGEKVKVVDCGHRFTTYASWFDDIEGLSLSEIAKYDYNDNCSTDDFNCEFEVVTFNYDDHNDNYVYFIKNMITDKNYLIKEIGLDFNLIKITRQQLRDMGYELVETETYELAKAEDFVGRYIVIIDSPNDLSHGMDIGDKGQILSAEFDRVCKRWEYEVEDKNHITWFVTKDDIKFVD